MRLSIRGNDIKLFLPPYPYRSAAAISLDYETSAQTLKPSLSARLRTGYRKILSSGKFKDFSSGYGRGYGNRAGAALVKKVFDDNGMHGTWFSTGHALLKGNIARNSFRINQKLEYASEENGFGFIAWRRGLSSFYHEPYGDFKSHPYFYLGDLTASLKERGEDIQSHSFSHPYIPLESPENLSLDLEDWQQASEKEGTGKADIFAFPYLGDYYCKSKKTGGIMLPSLCVNNNEYEEVYLSSEQTEIFRKNGFGLFTRCMSREGEKESDDFREYNGSGIYYILSRGLFSFGSNDELVRYITDLSEKCNIADLWFHPNDILDEQRYAKFVFAVESIKKKRDSGLLWAVTLKEMWERRKLISGLNAEAAENGFVLINDSEKGIENLYFETGGKKYSTEQSEAVRIKNGSAFSISLRPGEKVNFEEEVSG